MSQYLFSVIHDYVNNPPIADPVEDAEMFARVGAFNDSIKEKIIFLGGLYAPDSAASASIRDGNAVVTDGPFIESKEAIGGLWVIDCVDRDEAISLAKRATATCGVPVEIRPFHEI